MTRDEYKALPGVNFSTLKELLRSPAHYKAAVARQALPPTDEDTKRFALGSMAHGCTLEGLKPSDLFAVIPEGMKLSTKAGLAWKAENEGRQSVPFSDAQDAIAMRDVAVSHPDAAALIKGCGEREYAVTGTIHGVQCKGLIDLAGPTETGWAFGDYKTTTDARASAFVKKVEEFSYEMQFGMYSELLMQTKGCDVPYFFWIVQENKSPYTVQVFTPTAEMIERGKQKLEKALSIYSECQRTGIWPGYSTGIQPLAPVSWAKEI